MVTCAIGTDHRGFALKQKLLVSQGIEWIDVGALSEERSDFPVFAHKVVEVLHKGNADCAVLLCGNGIGMSIAANRFAGIYAALAWNVRVAQEAKEHNNANILVLPADFISLEEARAMIDVWLNSKFQSGRYQLRNAMIDAITDK